MAPIRISDRWLAVGLLTVAYLSACLISWHKSEGERLDAEAKETAHESEKTRLAAQEQTRVRTEDDIQLEWLATLTRSPDFEIREAATAIVLHRFAANAACVANLRSKLKDKNGDAEEKAQLESLRDLAHTRFDLYIPISQSPQFLIPRARRTESDLMASPVTPDNAAQSLAPAVRSALWIADRLRQISAGFTSADASPVFNRDQVAALLSEEPERLDTPSADESMALLGELPMDERDSEDDYQQLFDDETQRRRQRREAIAIGNLEDGLEIYEPVSEVMQEATADELIEEIRGLGDQVQGLLDTIEQIHPEP